VRERETRTVPRAQALLRGRARVAQLWAKSVGAVRLRALPFFLVQQGCLRIGVSRCGLAAVVGGGVRCFVGVNLLSSTPNPYVCCFRRVAGITKSAKDTHLPKRRFATFDRAARRKGARALLAATAIHQSRGATLPTGIPPPRHIYVCIFVYMLM